jgi:adenylate cyclase
VGEWPVSIASSRRDRDDGEGRVIGLASGPVVGGVIGQQRILFDLWGDTVNTAARMQATGIPGRIQVSAGTMERVSGRFRFEPRVVDVKGLGRLTTYLLLSSRV